MWSLKKRYPPAWLGPCRPLHSLTVSSHSLMCLKTVRLWSDYCHFYPADPVHCRDKKTVDRLGKNGDKCLLSSNSNNLWRWERKPFIMSFKGIRKEQQIEKKPVEMSTVYSTTGLLCKLWCMQRCHRNIKLYECRGSDISSQGIVTVWRWENGIIKVIRVDA